MCRCKLSLFMTYFIIPDFLLTYALSSQLAAVRIISLAMSVPPQMWLKSSSISEAKKGKLSFSLGSSTSSSSTSPSELFAPPNSWVSPLKSVIPSPPRILFVLVSVGVAFPIRTWKHKILHRALDVVIILESSKFLLASSLLLCGWFGCFSILYE